MKCVLKFCSFAIFSAILCACGSGFDSLNARPYESTSAGPFCCLASGGAWSAPRSNLIDNPGFENKMNSWQDWGNSALSSTAHTGTQSLKIIGGIGGAGQEVIYRLKTGGTYQLKAFGRVSFPSDPVYIGISFFDLSNGLIGQKRVQVTTTDFAEYSVQFTLPAQVSSAKVNVWKPSTTRTTAEFDDFMLTPIGDPIPPPSLPPIANPKSVQPINPGSDRWNLVFNEEFSGTSLNTNIWNQGFWFNYTINNELQAYRPENLKMNGETLSILTEKRATTTTWGEPVAYASGAITSRNKFTFTFGMIEARLRMPKGRGLAPAFWLLPSNKRSPPQIDIVSMLGQDPFTLLFNYMWLDETGIPHGQPMAFSGPNFSDDFHTYGINWTADEVVYMVDGAQVGSFRGDFVLRDPAFILLNVAVGGDKAGAPDASTVFPQSLQVDYVRIWQKVTN